MLTFTHHGCPQVKPFAELETENRDTVAMQKKENFNPTGPLVYIVTGNYYQL